MSRAHLNSGDSDSVVVAPDFSMLDWAWSIRVVGSLAVKTERL
jgi:hypothetical protein